MITIITKILLLPWYALMLIVALLMSPIVAVMFFFKGHHENQVYSDSQQLNDREIKALNALRKADLDTIWGVGIKQVLREPTPTRVRKLICELKSQNDDQPDAMQRILGPAYKSVIEL